MRLNGVEVKHYMHYNSPVHAQFTAPPIIDPAILSLTSCMSHHVYLYAASQKSITSLFAG
jgi:hypothetical protein